MKRSQNKTDSEILIQILVYTIVICTLLPCILCSAWEFNRQNIFRHEKNEAVDYMEKKYGKKFVAEKAYYHSRFLGMHKHIRVDIHPEDDPELRLYAINAADGEVHYTQLGQLQGRLKNYQQLFWGREIDKELEKIIEKNFDAPYKIESFIDTHVSGEFYDSLYGKTITLQDMKTRYPDLEKKFRYVVEVYFFKELKYDDRKIEGDKIFKLMKYIEEHISENVGLYVNYYNSPEQGLYKKGYRISIQDTNDFEMPIQVSWSFKGSDKLRSFKQEEIENDRK